MFYCREMIRAEIARQGYIGMDPRHVEGYMRVGHSTLDGLSWRQFQKEIAIGIECTRIDGTANADKICTSLGL